jgi:hypothetical protein
MTLRRRQSGARYDRSKQVAALWMAGLGPTPSGVLIDTDGSTRRRKEIKMSRPPARASQIDVAAASGVCR